MTAKTDILLATYNGAAHLPVLLDSLLQQTKKDWRLIVRDDGSNDDTPELIGKWVEQTGVEAMILPQNGENLGSSGNFSALMAASDAPYFAFCDQDDYWLPEKLEVLLAAIRDKEQVRGCDCPVLAHSDLTVVDEAMQAIHPSFWLMSRVQPEHPNARRKLMVQNYVTGCATMGNAALRSAALPVPDNAIMHDWWLALVAAFFGELVNIKAPTICYRQHGGNVIGAKTWSPLGIVQRFVESPSEAIFRSRRIVRRTAAQAQAFVDRFGDRLEPDVREMFAEYGKIQSASVLARKTFFLRKRVKPDYLPRALVHWFFM
jgi:glycosyltransferase involved in cell wall biosynthesis